MPFEFDKGGKCHLLASQYSFKNKYEGTYYYIDLNQYPIIKNEIIIYKSFSKFID